MENLNKQLTMSGPKIRAKSFGVFGKEKHKIIKSVMSRYNTAMEHNFHLEATALIESLISDRLESRLAQLTNNNITFDTLGNLLIKLRKIEEDVILIEIMNKQINQWCGERNSTIHQAAKIELNQKKDWNEFLKLAEKTAKNGRKIFDKYNSQLQKIRRTKK